MTDTLLKVLGVDVSQIPDDAQISWALAGAPRSWLWFVYLAVVGAALLAMLRLYRREWVGLPRTIRSLLAGLRAATLGLLALIFLAPSLSITRKRTVEPQVLVLIDHSQSMSVADRYADDAHAERVAAAVGLDRAALRSAPPTRLDLVRRLLARDGGRLWRDWQTRGQLKWFAFAHRLQPLPAAADARGDADAEGHAATPPDSAATLDQALAAVDALPSGLADLQPLGHGTLLAQAIRESLRSAGASPVAAVVLISDGQNTASRDAPSAAASAAARQQTPLFALGVGDPQPPRNVLLASLHAEEQVWRNDPFEIRSTVVGQGFGGTSVDVELLEQRLFDDEGPTESPESRPSEVPLNAATRAAVANSDPVANADPAAASAASGVVVARQTVVLPADDRPLPVAFRHRAAREGQYTYTVRVAPQPNEWTADDNAQTARVRVLEDQLRVLLVSGEPTWDYRFVTGLWTRDATIDLSCWLQSLDLEMPQEGDTPLDKLPRTLDQLGKFDVIVLFDPDPADLDEAWFDVVREYLSDRAGGFLFAAGPKYAERWLSDSKARGLRDLLPVRLDEADAAEVETLTTRHQQEWPLAVPPLAADHPLLKFTADAAANQLLWQRMPGVYWTFAAQQAKPGARVLLEHSDPALRSSHGGRPLFVAGQYGAGRTAYLGLNSTWRWRRLGKNSEYFNRFWVQACRYLVEGKLFAGRRRGTLDSSAARYQLGETATITARLFDSALEPLPLAKVTGRVRAAGAADRSFELTSVANQPGQFEGSLVLDRPGDCELSIELPGATPAERVKLVRSVRVEPPRVEFVDTRLNRGLLQELADESGGAYLDLDQAADLAAAIPDRRRTTLVVGEPAPLWDTGRMALLLIGLMSLEWALRKRFQLL